MLLLKVVLIKAVSVKVRKYLGLIFVEDINQSNTNKVYKQREI